MTIYGDIIDLTPKEDPMEKCLVCNKEFDTTRALATHQRFAHKESDQKPKKKLTEIQIDILIEEWGKKTTKEFAKEFAVDENEINNTVKQLRKAVDEEGNNANLCPPLRGSEVVKSVLAKRGLKIV